MSASHLTGIDTVGGPASDTDRGDKVDIGTVSLCAGRGSARTSRGACCATWPARPPQHQRVKQLTDNNCLSGLIFSLMLGLAALLRSAPQQYWFIIKLVDHPRLCLGAVASAEVEDSSKFTHSG